MYNYFGNRKSKLYDPLRPRVTSRYWLVPDPTSGVEGTARTSLIPFPKLTGDFQCRHTWLLIHSLRWFRHVRILLIAYLIVSDPCNVTLCAIAYVRTQTPEASCESDISWRHPFNGRNYSQHLRTYPGQAGPMGMNETRTRLTTIVLVRVSCTVSRTLYCRIR
jgi:hypothetical protein